MDRIKFQVIIIGAGPAGTACANHLHSHGVDALLINATEIGGSLNIDYDYQDCKGLWCNSIELRNKINVTNLNIYSARATNCVFANENWAIDTDRNKTFQSEHLVIATGLVPRSGGYTESNRILVGPTKKAFLFPYKGKSIAILGGGDNAFEHALIALKNGASSVTVFARTVRAKRHFIDQATLLGVHISEFPQEKAEQKLNGVLIKDEVFDVCLVFFGFEATRLPLTPDIFERDHAGRFYCDSIQNQAYNLVAIGDVASGVPLTISAAIESGISGANKILNKID